MADQNQVERVQQGAAAWNTWRKQHSDVEELDLREARFSGAHLSGADLSGADLSGANLRGANLGGAILREASLREANLSDADLSGANLSDADLSGANLSDADLRGADLSDADLSDADLSGANFSGANLSRAHLWGTILANLDLRSVQGLIEIYHMGPSLVSLHSILLPQDGSMLHFLRGAGISDEWIGFYRATIMHPIQYQSVFISYSSDDESISKRLHADLQANGVRCWFAPHDLKPGDFFRQEIDKAIHVQDKLLLILSEKSVTSKWVRYEVNSALDREVNQERTILFPLRI